MCSDKRLIFNGSRVLKFRNFRNFESKL